MAKGYEVINDLTNDIETFTRKRDALKELDRIEKGFVIYYDEDNDVNEIIKTK